MFLICLLCCAYISIPSQRYSRVVDWIWNLCSLNILDSQIHIMLLETQRRLPIVSLANHIAICLYGLVLSSTTTKSTESNAIFGLNIEGCIHTIASLDPSIFLKCVAVAQVVDWSIKTVPNCNFAIVVWERAYNKHNPTQYQSNYWYIAISTHRTEYNIII